MLIVERQQRLLNILRQRGAAPLDELSRALDVSSSTVRRDLEALAKQGIVDRTHGGAVLRTDNGSESSRGVSAEPSAGESLAARMRDQVEAKQAIAAYAASLVKPNMTVMLDGGSTIVYTARLITARPLQVVTNSLTICQVFKDDEQVELIMVGGNLYPRTEVTVGPIARQALADLYADILFTSFAAAHDGSAYNINLDMARVEQTMMRQASRSVLLMDSSKFGRKSLVRVAGLDAFEQIVTDAGIDAHTRGQLGESLVVV